jgi:hypothetical protein
MTGLRIPTDRSADEPEHRAACKEYIGSLLMAFDESCHCGEAQRRGP